MENVDKRVDIKLLTHWKNIRGSKGVETFISMPNFKSASVFSENLVAVHMGLLKVYYDKPLYPRMVNVRHFATPIQIH
ncbi:hypothetical protein NQ318_001287 [Aromia moschata]|uniref:Uncharacterized protein n=1 Tax=Aromia moschata TaxID=1265417 RepID=A0AAV8ZHV5_9CUCU|nr:hypothetical protein NQ318_001287 [Aromia moschata]